MALLTQCYVFKITSRNNRDFGFTSLDRTLTIDGLLYEPIGGANPTATSQEVGLAIDNIRLELLLEDNLQLTPRYATSGALSQAPVVVGFVDYLSLPSTLTGSSVIFTGNIASVDVTETSINLEILNITQKLNKRYDYSINAACRFTFGDSNCTFDLAAGGLLHQVNITAIIPNTTGYQLEFGAFSFTGNYSGGKLTFLDGDNQGMFYRIVSATGNSCIIAGETPEPIQTGTLVEVRGACDKSVGACKAYNNFFNFGGARQGGNHFRSTGEIERSI